ncbi:MAG: outer membrane lipoprotein carrier protein LolA [Bacteroidia bacterium]
MKKLVNIFLLATIPFSLLAQPAPKDKAADKLLNTISARYKKFKSIKADFTYHIESKADNGQEKQRGVIFIKNNKFKLDIAGQIIICDNANIWTYSKEVNEVQISTYNPKQATIRLEDIFTMYDKGFLYKIVEEKKDAGKELVVVELTPKDKKKSFFKIKLTIDKTNQTILKSVVYDKNGTTHTYTITNQYPNVKLEDKFFSFDPKKYPGIEVIDLRN